MATKAIKCKYGCETMLEGFNEAEHKYYEQGTTTIHTAERCKSIKAGEIKIIGDTTVGKFYGTTPSKGHYYQAADIIEINKKLDKILEILNKITGQDSLL